MEAKKIILVIMDGWGLGKIPASDAIQQAETPFVSSLYNKYPNTTLTTFGEEVGLPQGQMGNSEVGHLNIGAGRIVYQELQRINVAIKTGELTANKAFVDTLDYAKTNNKALHLIGLVSDGGVHSHIEHIKAITTICAEKGIQNVFIHAFTDGRDTDPKSGLGFIKALEAHLDQSTGKIASVTGRYYAMDRDKRWERVKIAYDALTQGVGVHTNSITDQIVASYKENIFDEFIMPIVKVDENNQTIGTIKEGDAVLCFNFRTDRCREITEVLTQIDLPEHQMHKLQLYYTTITEYDKTFKGVNVVFETDNLVNTLGEVVERAGLEQIRIAETEKYPHVTFFFNGGRETPFKGETRLMAQSPKVATYDLQPEMSANEITNLIVPEIEKRKAGFICLNFANADMVGHTGVFEAVVKAVETVDHCVEKVVTTALANGYTIFLTADHGNADFMINEDGSPNTAHTMNPVPFFIIDNDWNGTLNPGKLGDIAPTMLKLMNIEIPAEMTGGILMVNG
ncbi:MAG: 2,3-bisphosphoglycerate-independent phosphoglycerate mutase [Chitinophagaceae bacterium]|nr:2,3-bisphosphoglycerate-independent phosphoglycerate mutase [Chitinophagaceae bacterium]